MEIGLHLGDEFILGIVGFEDLVPGVERGDGCAELVGCLFAESRPDAILLGFLHGEDKEEREGQEDEDDGEVDIREPGEKCEKGAVLVVDILHDAASDLHFDRLLFLAQAVHCSLHMERVADVAVEDAVALGVGHVDGDGGVVLDDGEVEIQVIVGLCNDESPRDLGPYLHTFLLLTAQACGEAVGEERRAQYQHEGDDGEDDANYVGGDVAQVER